MDELNLRDEYMKLRQGHEDAVAALKGAGYHGQERERLQRSDEKSGIAQANQAAQASEIDQKIAAMSEYASAFNGAYSTVNRAPDYSEQPGSLGTAAPHPSSIPYEYQEDYRNADMWTGAARWPGLFRQVVEELGQRDATITRLHGQIDELQRKIGKIKEILH